MLNMLWAGMMSAGIFWAAFHGNMGEVTNGLLDSAKEAVTLGVTMLGIMSFWCGILKIGERAGLIEALTEKMRPVIRFLFPNLPDGHPAGRYIATNMIANMLGLGWAATPAGLKAMEELGKLEEERRAEKAPDKRKNTAGQSSLARQSGTASNEMCTFLTPAHPHQHDRLPQPVRQCQPGGYRRTGAPRDHRQHGGGNRVLQGHGPEKR